MALEDESISPPAAETRLWKGHSSQWVHFWFYFFSLLIAAGVIAAGVLSGGIFFIGLVVPFFMVVIRWLITKATTYELTTQRLIKDSGILNRLHDELELYRVKDYTLERSFLERLLGLGTLKILTSDVTNPTVVMRSIPQSQEVREKLRTAVQAERDRKRVREMDVGDSDSAGAVF